MHKFTDIWRRRRRQELAQRFLQSHVSNRVAWQGASFVEDLADPSGETDLLQPRGFIEWDAWRTPGGDIL